MESSSGQGFPWRDVEYWMTCRVKCLVDDLQFHLINVYGLIKTEDKARVWNELSNRVKTIGKDWLVIVGDFNAILDLNDKNGGLRKSNRVMEDFREFVAVNEVFDVVPKNGQFTLTNRRLNFMRILERLDKFLVGSKWMEGQYSLAYSTLSNSIFDHFPVQLELDTGNAQQQGSFKFQSMWWRDRYFLENLKCWWEESNIFVGTPSFCFVKRLHFLKDKIKKWNVESFKNIFAEKLRLEEELASLNEKVMYSGITNLEFEKEKELKDCLAGTLRKEEIFWRDKSREMWIVVGD